MLTSASKWDSGFTDTGGQINVRKITSMDGQQPIFSDFLLRKMVLHYKLQQDIWNYMHYSEKRVHE